MENQFLMKIEAGGISLWLRHSVRVMASSTSFSSSSVCFSRPGDVIPPNESRDDWRPPAAK